MVLTLRTDIPTTLIIPVIYVDIVTVFIYSTSYSSLTSIKIITRHNNNKD